MVDYSLWEVIENGNKPLVTTVIEGVETIIALATAEEKAQRRNKPEIDTLSLDDLYKNLKIYEPEVKGTSSSNTNTQNVAFVSSNSTSNTNGAVNTAHEVYAASSQVNTVNSSNIDNLSDAVIHAFLASQPSSPQLLNLKGNETVAFDKTKMECYNCHKRGHFARKCKAPRAQDNKNRESTRRTILVETPASSELVSCDGLRGYNWSDQAEDGSTNFALMANSTSSSDFKVLESVEARLLVYKKNKSVYEEDIKLLKHEIYLKEVAVIELRRKLELTQKQKDEIQLTVKNYENSSKSLSKLLDSQIADKCKAGLGYNVVPPPHTGNFLPLKPDLSSLQEFVNESIVSEPTVKKPVVETSEAKASADKPKDVRKNFGRPLIED
nr:hypothetical protein [Tanacetum cinerariifolium]